MKAALLSFTLLAIALPAAAQDARVWSLVEADKRIMLFYGTPDSDDLWAGFSCRSGSGEAIIHLTLEHQIGVEKTDNEVWMDAHGEAEPWEVQAAVAGRRTDASAHPDEMNGGSTLEIQAPVGGAILTDVARRGRLKAKAFGEVVDPPPFRKADFDRFVEVCGP